MRVVAFQKRSEAQYISLLFTTFAPERMALMSTESAEDLKDLTDSILVCDQTYGVLGSFNWLSYRGELDEQYRKETSIVLREPKYVVELTKIALRGWPV